MDENNGLKVGGIYDTVIGAANVGEALYIGKTLSNRTDNTNTIIFRDRDKKVRCWQFPSSIADEEHMRTEKLNYIISVGILKISDAYARRLSPKEESYLESRLKKVGL